MDCRTSACLVIGLLMTLSGCDRKGGLPLQGARQPKAMTCVAYADFRLRESYSKKLSPTRQNELRDQARVAYEQALKVDPGCVAAHRGLAEVHMALGSIDSAIEGLEKALDKKPETPSLWMTLGMCHSRRKDWSAATAAMRKAVEYAPRERKYVQTLGFCLARAGEVDESLNCLKGVMSEAEAHLSVARMLKHVGKTDQSREHLDRALQLTPSLPEAHRLLAELNSPKAQSNVRPVRYEERAE